MIKKIFLLLLVVIISMYASVYSAVSGEAAFLEPGLVGNPDILWFAGYETAPNWQPPWGIQWGPTPAGNFSITTVNVFKGNYAARVKYPQGLESTSGSGSQYQCILANMTPISIPAAEAMYIRYYVRFDPNFDFVLGGKLPGLCGAGCNTGGGIPTGRDGWSARIMWRENGKIVQYMYYMDQASYYGDDFPWNEGVGGQRYLIPGQWHCLETYIQMNTPGVKNGIVRSWFDGQLSLNRTNIRFRDTGYDNIKIDKLYFSTFFGGAGSQWAPKKDEYANFDNFVLSRSYIGPYMEGTPTRTVTINPLWSPTSTFTPTPTIDPACFISGQSWENISFTQQTGTFTFVFSGVPSATIIDSVMGLSDGQAAGYTSIAAAVRFNTTGTIDMRNGSAYQAASTINYQAGKKYYFRMIVNVASKTYSAYVLPDGGNEITIGLNYAFRTEQAGVTKLNNFAAYTTGGTNMICGPGIQTTASPTNTPTRTNTTAATFVFTSSFTRTNTFTSTRTNTMTPVATQTITQTNTRVITNTFTVTPTMTVTSSQVVSSTRTSTMTSTQVESATRTSTMTMTQTLTYSRTSTSIITPTSTLTRTSTSIPTFSQTSTSSQQPTNTCTSTRTATPTLTGTGTRTPTSISTRTQTPSITPTFTRTITQTHSVSPTITQTSTGTPPSPTNSPTRTPSWTITVTYTYTRTGTPTNTFTLTASVSSTGTNTTTYTRTPTSSPTPTMTNTQVITNTWTGTLTRTATQTSTNTATPIYTSTATRTLTMTNTQVITNAWTGTPTGTGTSTRTMTPSFTQTATSSQQPTNTYTPTSTRTQIENRQLKIENLVLYPNPYNPTKGDLRINILITGQLKLIKVKIYTTGFRLIKQITYEGDYAGEETLTIDKRYLNNLANGICYILITGINKDETIINSKPVNLIILK